MVRLCKLKNEQGEELHPKTCIQQCEGLQEALDGKQPVGDYITAEDVDLSNYVTKDDLKTINGESILGNGDIVIEGGDSSEVDITTVEITPTATKTGYYYDRSGVLTKNVYSASIDMSTYDVSKFNKIHVYCKTASLIASYWEDADGNLTQAFAGKDADNYIVDSDYDIPEGTVYLHNSYMTSPTPAITNKSYIEGAITIDQEYNPESENPQSGKAVAQAIADSIPAPVNVELEAESVQNSAFLNSSGVVDTTTNGHAVCQIIRYPVTAGSTIHVTCVSASLCYSYWVDASGTRTLAFGGAMSSYNIDMDLNVPDTAIYFDLTCRNDKGTPVVSGKSVDVNSIIVAIQNQMKGQFRGRKIGIIGDSIAVGEKLNSGDKNFITVFAESVGASGVKNVAVGGWDYCDKDSHGVYRQVSSLDGDEDLIIIFAGTNDFGHHSPLGEAWTHDDDGIKIATTDTYATTFCGGIHKAVETIWSKFGYVPIVMCTPLHRNYPSTNEGYPDTSHWKNTQGKYIDDYISAIEKVASFYGIPVFNSYRLTGLYPINATQNTGYFADGIHPNAKGHKVIGESLANFVKSLYLPLK